MSVMTAAGQKRRAGATRGRRAVTAVPGQPNVMAGPWPGAGELPGRTAHGAPGGVHDAPGRPSRHDTARTAGPRPPAGKKEAAPPSAAQVPAARPPVARQSARSDTAGRGAVLSGPAPGDRCPASPHQDTADPARPDSGRRAHHRERGTGGRTGLAGGHSKGGCGRQWRAVERRLPQPALRGRPARPEPVVDRDTVRAPVRPS